MTACSVYYLFLCCVTRQIWWLTNCVCIWFSHSIIQKVGPTLILIFHIFRLFLSPSPSRTYPFEKPLIGKSSFRFKAVLRAMFMLCKVDFYFFSSMRRTCISCVPWDGSHVSYVPWGNYMYLMLLEVDARMISLSFCLLPLPSRELIPVIEAYILSLPTRELIPFLEVIITSSPSMEVIPFLKALTLPSPFEELISSSWHPWAWGSLFPPQSSRLIFGFKGANSLLRDLCSYPHLRSWFPL